MAEALGRRQAAQHLALVGAGGGAATWKVPRGGGELAAEAPPVGLAPEAPMGMPPAVAAGEGGAGPSHILVAPAVQPAPSSRSKGNQASRHKNAEQRQRNRINKRLDKLRVLIPHAEGTKIATFLDTVIDYVGKIQEISDVVPGEALPARADVAAVAAAPGEAVEPSAKGGAEPRPPTPEQSGEPGTAPNVGGTAAVAAAAVEVAAKAAEAAASAATTVPGEAGSAPAAKRPKVAALG